MSQGLLAVCALAVVVLAFLAGRWTSPDIQNEVVTTNGAIDSSDPEVPEPVLPGTSDPERKPLDLPSKNADRSEMMADSTAKSSEVLAPETMPDMIQPQPDKLNAKRYRLTQRERMLFQLDSVLTCLADNKSVDAACCQTLLPRRAEFEYMLGEVIRTATGQRQMAAVTAIGFIGTDGSVPTLLKTSKQESLKDKAIAAARRCSSEQMLAGVVLQPSDESLKKEFLTELAQRKPRNAVLAWLHLMRSPETRDLCLQVIDEVSPALIDAMFTELDAPLLDDRIAAILTRGRRTDKPTQNRIMQLAQQFPNRWEPVAILMWNGSEPAIKTLTQLQRNPERFAVLQTAAIQLEASVGLPKTRQADSRNTDK